MSLNKTVLYLVVLFLCTISCKNNSIPKVDEAITYIISEKDYYINYRADEVEVYYLNNESKMNGEYLIKKEKVLYEKMNLENGLLIGVYKLYYSNGKTAREILYHNGQKNGKSKFYYKNGKIKRESTFVKNKNHGKTIYYHEYDGSIEMINESIDGLDYSKFYENDKIYGEEYELNHEIGKITVVKAYNDDGSIIKIFGFKNDDSEASDVLYLMDEKHMIKDSINVTKNPQKLKALMLEMGPRFMK